MHMEHLDELCSERASVTRTAGGEFKVSLYIVVMAVKLELRSFEQNGA